MANTIGETTTNGPETEIMDSYIHLNPRYKVIAERKSEDKVIKYQRVIKITLNTGKQLVLKHMRLSSKCELNIRELYKEYRIGNLLGLLTNGAVGSLDIKEKVEGSDTIVEILMEYGGESLQDIIKNEELKHGDCFKITLQLLNTLTLMEKMGISHLDIKPQNIAWDRKEDKVKLIDFGTSVLFYDSASRLKENVSIGKVTGYTRSYAAPEIVKNEKEVNLQKLDVYSFGVTFVRLLVSEYGIENPITYNEDGYVNHIDVDLIAEQLPELKDVKELISDMICVEPDYRCTFNELRLTFLKFLEKMGSSEIVEEIKDITLDVLLYLEASQMEVADSSITLGLSKYNKEELIKEYGKLGYIFYELENNRLSTECFKRALKMCSKINKEGLIIINIYYWLGLVHFNSAEYNTAIYYFEKTLNIRLKIYEKEHTEIANCYMKLRSTYEVVNENKRTLDFYNTTLDIERKIYEEQHLKIAGIYDDLGNIYSKLDNDKKAIEYFKKALDIQLKIGGEQSPHIAITYANLARIYYHLCNYNKAKNYYYRSLNIILKTVGEQHLNTAILYNSLGRIHFGGEDYEKAKDYYKKALNIVSNIGGEHHSSIAHSYNGLGDIYF